MAKITVETAVENDLDVLQKNGQGLSVLDSNCQRYPSCPAPRSAGKAGKGNNAQLLDCWSILMECGARG